MLLGLDFRLRKYLCHLTIFWHYDCLYQDSTLRIKFSGVINDWKLFGVFKEQCLAKLNSAHQMRQPPCASTRILFCLGCQQRHHQGFLNTLISLENRQSIINQGEKTCTKDTHRFVQTQCKNDISPTPLQFWEYH